MGPDDCRCLRPLQLLVRLLARHWTESLGSVKTTSAMFDVLSYDCEMKEEIWILASRSYSIIASVSEKPDVTRKLLSMLLYACICLHCFYLYWYMHSLSTVCLFSIDTLDSLFTCKPSKPNGGHVPCTILGHVSLS